jgi:hypothetical protein
MVAVTPALLAAQVVALAVAAAVSSSPPVSGGSAEPLGAAATSGAVASLPTPGPNDVVVENSGSTNTFGYRILVRPDATVYVLQNGAIHRTIADKADVTHFLAAVKAAGPLSAMTSGHCMRSASFGSSTRITYAGESTGDLTCGAGPAAQDLAAQAQAIVQDVGIPRFRSFRSFPLPRPAVTASP